MKKMNFLLALCFGTCAAFAQQPWPAKNWAMPNNDFNTTVSPPTNSAIGFGPTVNSSNKYTSSAGAYDGSGNLQFFVQDNVIYHSTGSINLPTTSIAGNTYNSPGHEVDIVPVPGTADCNKYYVIYELAPQSGGGSAVAYVMVDCSSGTPVKTNPANNILITSTTGNGIAVSKISAGVRFLFTMDWSSALKRFTISPWNSGTSKGIDGVTTVSTLTGTILTNSDDICEMELSPDQTRLAWNAHFNVNAVYEVVLNSSFAWTATNTYTITGVSEVYGLQYAQPTASTLDLYVGTSSGITYFTPGGSPTYHTLTSTTNYGTTQLGRMATGSLMGVYSGGATPARLFEINVVGHTLALSSNTTQVFSNTTVHNSLKGVYHIPDGLDNSKFSDAGPNQINQQDICGQWTPGVTLGTAAVSGCTYSWGPSTGLVAPTTSATVVSTYSTTMSSQSITYTVTVTSAGGCVDKSTVQVTAKKNTCPGCCREMNPDMGTHAHGIFNVYPNPASTDVTVALYGPAEYIRVVDLSGKVVFESKDISDTGYTIDVTKFKKGIYFVIAKIGDKLEKQKLLIE